MVPDAAGPISPICRWGRGAVVWWLAVTAAGFVLSTALVIGLALPATARWEAEGQEPDGPRAILPPAVRGGAALH